MGDEDLEFSAMQRVYSALEPLDEEARRRVFIYVASRFCISVVGTANTELASRGNDDASAKGEGSSTEFDEFGEFFDVFDPKSDVERALTAAYWASLQNGDGSFDSQALNTMLKNLGHGVANITRALGGLADQKPALVI